MMQKCKQYVALILLVCTVTIWGAFALSRASSSVAAWSQRDDIVVVIDAGHGGEDGGACSAGGVRESGINLEISLRLNDLLHFLGLRTVMVRNADVSISTEGSTIAQRKVSDIRNRVKLVESTPKCGFCQYPSKSFLRIKISRRAGVLCRNTRKSSLGRSPAGRSVYAGRLK